MFLIDTFIIYQVINSLSSTTSFRFVDLFKPNDLSVDIPTAENLFKIFMSKKTKSFKKKDKTALVVEISVVYVNSV